ncbi:MAG TPA: hypothetical protein VH350_17590 [Candidatus Sulfotelmatobacter sp.]|jgi:hypothetical protein|nr:hypothetical protein [Candidatus Sulfotelmatobacter sp.]
MSVSETCALCHNVAKLRNSHIVPSFFGAHLRESSATGYFRNGEMPNLRAQDLPKQKLLCDCCEGRFAVWERDFKENVLPVVQSDGFNELKYGPLLLYFLVSLSWRILVIQRELLSKSHPDLTNAVSQTLENWRLFLLGRNKLPGSEHHMFVIDIPVRMSNDLHEKFLQYLMRGIDAGTGGSGNTLFVCAKPLRSLVFSPVIPASSKGWINTRVRSVAGRLVSPQKIEMPGFLDFLNSRATEGHAKPLSDTQRLKIQEAIVKQPLRALGSESYKVHVAGQQLTRKN